MKTEKIIIPENVVTEINLIPPEEFAARGIVQLAKDRKSYCCPACPNGTGNSKGKKGNGITPKMHGGIYKWKCFSCDKKFNNIGILASHYGLDTRADFVEICRRACNDFGIYLPNNDFAPNPARKVTPAAPSMKEQPKKAMTQELQEVINADIKTARANWDKLSPENKFGITDATAEFWQLGAIFNWTTPKARLSDDNPEKNKDKQYPSPRVIFPHLTNPALPDIPLTYCAGLLMTERRRLDALGKNYSKYLYGGIRTPYGLQTLTPTAKEIFVTEGEKDCISLWQATGGKYPCLATGGTALNLVFDALADFYGNKKPVIYFFADNDKAGKNFVKDFTDAARQAGFIAIPIYFADFNAPKLDANKILVEQENKKLAEIINEKIALAQDELSKITIAEVKEIQANSECEKLPNAPINLKLPETFNFNGGTLNHNKTSISFTPPLVTKKFLQGEKVLYEVAFLTDKKWKFTIVPAGYLYDKSKLLMLADYGVDVTSNYSKLITQYFSLLIGINADKIPVENLYTQGGWTDETCTDFIYPNVSKVLGNNFDYDAAFKIVGDRKKFYDLLTAALKDSYIACLVTGVALSAPLVKLVGVSNKQLHLGCRSGNGKTAIVKIALAIFGNPKFLMTKFNGTANALENFAVALNDFPSAVDEFQSIAKSQRENTDELLYNFESGNIRRRLKKDGTFQPFKYFSGCRITTGEQPLTNEFSNEGAKKRCVEINESNILRENLAIEIHRFTSKNFGFYGRDWIEYIKNHDQKILEDYDENYNKLFKQNSRAFPEHISLIALAQVALNHFCKNFFSTSAKEILSTFDVSKVFEQLPIRQDMQNGKRAILAVAELYSSHAIYFHNVTDDKTPPTTSDERAPFECYGYTLKNENIFIYPQVLQKTLEKFPNFQAILRDFADLGYLDVGKDKEHPYKKAIKIDGKKTIWGYIFKASALFETSANKNFQKDIEEDTKKQDFDMEQFGFNS